MKSDYLIEKSRQRVTLTGKPLGSGGEADVYVHPSDADRVIKIYHPGRRSPGQADKLRAMLLRPPSQPQIEDHPRHPTLAWPTDRVLAVATGEVVGYVMPRVLGMQPIFECYNASARAAAQIDIGTRELYAIATNLALATAVLHEAGYAIGDINQKNTLVLPQAGLVTLIDTDSFQVPNPSSGYFYCRVGTPDFVPPELHNVNLDQVVRTPHQDDFSLAVLLFQLLMDGFHPFQGVSPVSSVTTIEERIRAGRFPYCPRSAAGTKPPPAAPAIAVLPQPLQQLFERCFVDGHRQPAQRPSADTWASALHTALGALKPCGRSPRHHFAEHLANCPWCEREARLQGASGQVPVRKLATGRTQMSLHKLLATAPAAPRPSAPSLVPTPVPTAIARRTSGVIAAAPSVPSLAGRTSGVIAAAPNAPTAAADPPRFLYRLLVVSAIAAGGLVLVLLTQLGGAGHRLTVPQAGAGLVALPDAAMPLQIAKPPAPTHRSRGERHRPAKAYAEPSPPPTPSAPVPTSPATTSTTPAPAAKPREPSLHDPGSGDFDE